MIKDLHIQNYRLFKELNIDNLSQVNLIVGANNCGKSSLLEAIHLFSNESTKKGLDYILSQRGEFTSNHNQSFDKELEISHLFHGHFIEDGTSIKLESESIKTKLTMKIAWGNRNQHELLKESENQLALVCELEKDKNGPYFTKINLTEDGLRKIHPIYDTPAKSRVNQTSMLVTSNTLNYIELAALWDHITLTPKEDQVIEALQIIEPSVQRISFTSTWTADSGVLVRLANEAKPIPLGSMGDGMRRVLAIIASLVSVGNGNLLIDEIDTGLYHGVLTDMWRLVIQTAKQQGAQVFATTHSWDCVKAFQQALAMEEDDQVGRLIRLDRIGERTKVVSYDANRLEIAVSQEIEVR